jgi:cyclohexyl-isocyanide hydratase
MLRIIFGRGMPSVARVFKAAVILFPNVEELDFVGVWEVLGTTQHLAKEKYFQVRTLGTVSDPIKCAHGLTLISDETIENLSKYDVIIAPGGPGVYQTMKDEDLLREIRQAYESRKLVCSVCTGAFILANAGILKEKRATTYHTEVEKLSKYGAVPSRERVVVDDNVITGAGVAASMDVGLKIVEILLGKESARKVAEWIEYLP